MTVVFLCRFFYPHIGGVERHVLEVSKRLQKRGWKIIVITKHHAPELSEKEIFQDITIYRIPVTSNERDKKYVIWNWLFAHRMLLKKAKIIHCHDVAFWYMPFRILFPLKKMYLTFHGYEGNTVPTRRAIFMHKISEMFSAGNICVGDYLKKWYGTKTKYVTYGAVASFKNEASLSIKKVKEIVFIGRLDPDAGILRYLEVLNLLKQEGFLPHLSVLGDGILAEEAKMYARRHRLNVTFYGAVSDVLEFLARSDCVFTSRFLSTLESFAYRKHVFCLYNNSIHRDCFLLSPFREWISLSGETLQLSKNVASLMEHPYSKEEDVDHAYQWVKQQTWDKVTKLYLALWET